MILRAHVALSEYFGEYYEPAMVSGAYDQRHAQ